MTILWDWRLKGQPMLRQCSNIFQFFRIKEYRIKLFRLPGNFCSN